MTSEFESQSLLGASAGLLPEIAPQSVRQLAFSRLPPHIFKLRCDPLTLPRRSAKTIQGFERRETGDGDGIKGGRCVDVDWTKPSRSMRFVRLSECRRASQVLMNIEIEPGQYLYRLESGPCRG